MTKNLAFCQDFTCWTVMALCVGYISNTEIKLREEVLREKRGKRNWRDELKERQDLSAFARSIKWDTGRCSREGGSWGTMLSANSASRVLRISNVFHFLYLPLKVFAHMQNFDVFLLPHTDSLQTSLQCCIIVVNWRYVWFGSSSMVQ